MMKCLPIKICMSVLLALFGVTWAQASVTLNSTIFPDNNFRAALSAITGVAEGGTINEATLTELDVSNQGITNLKGLELLTGLTYLDISNNSNLTTGANITGLTALVTLKAKDCNIYTLADTSSGNYAGLVIGAGNANLKYLDLSHNADFYSSGNLQYLTHLETLLLNDCTNYDFWGAAPGLNMTSLKWVDVSNCPTMDRIFLRGATQLRHLNAKGTKVTGFSINASTTQTTAGYIVLANNCPLEYLNLADCSELTSFQAIVNAYHVTTLDTLILANATRINGWSSGITAQTGLKYCDLTNTGQTSTSVGFTSAFTSLETLILAHNSSFGYSSKFEHLSGLKYLDISYCDVFFRESEGSTNYLLHYLTPTNNPNLETVLASHSKLGQHTEGLTGFTNLKIVDVSHNVGSTTAQSMTQFWVNGSPELETLDISGNTALTELKLNNDSLPRNNFTLIGAETCTALNSLYLNDNKYTSVAQATSDFASISSLEFLHLQNNKGLEGELTLNAADCGNLKGLDLGNNGITSFSAPACPRR